LKLAERSQPKPDPRGLPRSDGPQPFGCLFLVTAALGAKGRCGINEGRQPVYLTELRYDTGLKC